MAFFTLEMYSAAMGRDTTVTVLMPTVETANGQPVTKGDFEGIWLLTCPGGLSTDWLRLTRHVENQSGRFMVIMPPDEDRPGYEEFIGRELPLFLAQCGLKKGAKHNVIGAHPENEALAEKLRELYPDTFGGVIPQVQSAEGGWRQANETISAYYRSVLGPDAVRK